MTRHIINFIILKRTRNILNEAIVNLFHETDIGVIKIIQLFFAFRFLDFRIRSSV